MLCLIGGIITGYLHKSEPEPRNGNVNTVYFIHQIWGNTQISHTEFVYNERTRDWIMFRIMFARNILLQISFLCLNINVRIIYIGWNLKAVVNILNSPKTCKCMETGAANCNVVYTQTFLLIYLSVKPQSLMKILAIDTLIPVIFDYY